MLKRTLMLNAIALSIGVLATSATAEDLATQFATSVVGGTNLTQFSNAVSSSLNQATAMAPWYDANWGGSSASLSRGVTYPVSGYSGYSSYPYSSGYGSSNPSWMMYTVNPNLTFPSSGTSSTYPYPSGYSGYSGYSNSYYSPYGSSSPYSSYGSYSPYSSYGSYSPYSSYGSYSPYSGYGGGYGYPYGYMPRNRLVVIIDITVPIATQSPTQTLPAPPVFTGCGSPTNPCPAATPVEETPAEENVIGRPPVVIQQPRALSTH